MLVKDLIKKLEGYDENMKVAIHCKKQNFEGITEITEDFKLCEDRDINSESVLLLEDETDMQMASIERKC